MANRARITVLIPTRNRPGPLARALASLGRITLPPDAKVDVLVVDNSADGNARAVVDAADLPHPIAMLHVAQPGVSTARNVGCAAAAGDIVAFLDDDCEASPTWLTAQLATLAATGADASFGPRIAAIEGPEPPDAAWFKDTYSRDLRLEDGADVTARTAHLPLPGSAFVKSRCLTGTPFDERLDAIGGEDVLLFRQLALDGRRFVWSPDARVTEHIPQSRIDHGFVLRRRYLSGQHRCLIPMLTRPPRWREMLEHMAKGALITALAGPPALLGRLSGRWPPVITGVLMSGLGKLTWWRRNRPTLYGHGHR